MMKYLKLFEQDFDDPFGEETYPGGWLVDESKTKLFIVKYKNFNVLFIAQKIDHELNEVELYKTDSTKDKLDRFDLNPTFNDQDIVFYFDNNQGGTVASSSQIGLLPQRIKDRLI